MKTLRNHARYANDNKLHCQRHPKDGIDDVPDHRRWKLGWHHLQKDSRQCRHALEFGEHQGILEPLDKVDELQWRKGARTETSKNYWNTVVYEEVWRNIAMKEKRKGARSYNSKNYWNTAEKRGGYTEVREEPPLCLLLLLKAPPLSLRAGGRWRDRPTLPWLPVAGIAGMMVVPAYQRPCVDLIQTGNCFLERK